MEDFLTPQSYTYQKVSPRSEPEEYLRQNENNIMAEFWMLLQNPSPLIFEVTTTKIVDAHSEAFEGITSIITHQKKHQATPPTTKENDPEVKEFHKHFGVLNGRYCFFVLTNAGQNMRIYTGSTCPKNHMESIDGASRHAMSSAKRAAFFDYGFIGDAINEVNACRHLLRCCRLDDNSMLHCVADPTKRHPADFVKPTSLSLPGFVPANVGQAKAIQSLNMSVEGIQGPPGTGKSTVIAHILHSSIPSSEVSLVTCVQNKAIDAIAEKLRCVDSAPFFVVGNENRLGLIAKQWTLAEQVSRDSRVVSLVRKLGHYKERKQVSSDFIRQKQNLLNNRYLGLRRQELAKFKFKKTEDEMNDKEKGELEVWLAVDPWHRVWNAYIANKFAVKLKYIEVVSRKIEGMNRDLGLLMAEVRAEIISKARAILATTATASGSLANDEELAPAFSKLRTIILDEAGTVPETKLPLLISLNPIELCRIVAIGDQNQLAPFTRKMDTSSSGGGSGGNRMCFAFARRGYCASRGRGCRFEHFRGSPTKGGRGGGGDNSEPPMGFFQRVEKAVPKNSIPILSEQFRMHPSVCNFVSDTFYNGRLCTNPLVRANRLRGDQFGMWWVTYRDKDAESCPPRSTSKINETEAMIALSILDREDLIGKTVMVITFYKAQETLMKRMFAKSGRLESESLRILSVVVILSCVRSNTKNNIGFLTNPNRMNVAVSRVKYQLIIIGCHSTLCTDAK